MKTALLAALATVALAAPALAGNISGKTLHHDQVDAYGKKTFFIEFTDGMAIVVVGGDGDTDLDMVISDDRGNQVCSDLMADDAPMCAFEVRRTGVYRVEIENLGDVYNQFFILTN